MTYVDRFGKNEECAILNLNVSGFEKLTLKEKTLAYFLSMAGLAGNAIYMQQINKYNLKTLNLFTEIFNSLDNKEHPLKEIFLEYFKLFLFHNGIHHTNSNQLLEFPFTKDEFYSLKLLIDNELHSDLEFTYELILNAKKLLTTHDDSVDLVKESNVNFYENGLTKKDIEEYKEAFELKIGENTNKPMFGINSRYTKNNDGKVIEQKMFAEGLYSKEISDMVYYLTKALNYTENDIQHLSIKKLIEFYQSGEPFDFDNHSLAWVQDTESNVFFINGFIETYLDPLGTVGSFESVVAFKNPEQTAIVNKIIDNIQWFENNLPVDPLFRKTEAKGLSASSITVVSAGGESAPSLPLGICLPNSDWIRAEHGSKSVNLLNVHNARGSSEDNVKDEFFLPEYVELIKKYSSVSGSLHTDLHEIAGHGSGQTLPNVQIKDLANFYSIIEETRADLVGLYFCPDKKLQEFGIVNKEYDMNEFALAEYVSYFSNGIMLQLKRISSGDEIQQTHMRNRHLITSWILNRSKECKTVELLNINNKHFIKVNDIEKCRDYIGELLGQVQRIKSTGDFEGAKELILQYGTKFNINIQKEVLQRFGNLNVPSFYGFIMPNIIPVYDHDTIIDFHMNFDKCFIKNRINQTLKYKTFL